MMPPEMLRDSPCNSPRITPKQDEANISKIHAYYQMRVALRLFYPRDQPNSFHKNKERYEDALQLSPEGREALCAQINKSLVKQALFVGSVLLLCQFIL